MRQRVILWLALLLPVRCGGADVSFGIRSFAAGGTHSVVLASDQTVWTWGSNTHGQLGVGPAGAPPLPVEVYGLTGVVAISAGFAHTLAVKSDGTVWGWGKNLEGQLGDGTGIDRSRPVQVRGLGGVVAVAAGSSQSLALTSDGVVWSWGDLGKAAAAPVSGLNDVTAIAAGQAHNLALKRDGTVWAWGNNGYGQLGNGSLGGDPGLPAQVSGLAGVTAIAAGCQHSLALRSDGTVWAWGNDGVFAVLSPTPVEAKGLANIQAIAAGYGASVAVQAGGTVWHWGLDILSPPAGPYPEARPLARVPELAGTAKISLAFAYGHGMVLKADGSLWEWGFFGGGQPGWATIARTAPARVGELPGATAVTAGLALKNDGTVWVWEPPLLFNWNDQPVLSHVPGLDDVTAIASGAWGYYLALKNDGTVWNITGPLLYRVPNLSDATAVASGESRGLAVKRDGTVWEWSGVDGAPTQIPGLSDVAAVAEAFNWWWGESEWIRTIALRRDGTVWHWDNIYASRSAPVPVGGLSGIKAIAAGEISLALKDDGTVWQWSAAAEKPDAAQVKGIANVTAIAVGSPQPMSGAAQGLALRADGSVWAWGPNELGELGDGTTEPRAAPVQVAGLRDVVAITAVGPASLAARRDGGIWGWGGSRDSGAADWLPLSRVAPPGAPDLAIAMSHSGDFAVGSLGVYTVRVWNSGRTATSGPIALTDTLPLGLTFVSAAGDGWTCTEANDTVACSNPGPVAPGASTIITVTVRIGPAALPGVTNLAAVSNESDFNSCNNVIGDPVVVLPGNE